MIAFNLIQGDKILGELGADQALVNDVYTNPLYFQKWLVEEQGKLICASLARVTSEMTLLVAKDANKLEIQRAIMFMLKKQTVAAKELGIDQVHVWTAMDPNLMQHLGFKERDERSYILHF